MNQKKLVIFLLLIAAFMCVDGYAIYTYGIGENFTVFESILAGILIAALMNIPPFFIASHGFAVIADDTTDTRQKRTGKIITIIGSIYIFLILAAVVTMRVIQIMGNMADPMYSNLLMDVVFTVSPVLTTIFSIILGLRIYEPNIIKLREAFESSNSEYIEVKKRYDALYNDLKCKFETIGSAHGFCNFMEAVESGSEDITLYLNAIEKAAAPKITDRIRLHLKKLYNAMLEKINETRLYLDSYGPGPGIIAGHKPSNEFMEKAASLLVIDSDFEKMLNRQINDCLSKELRNFSTDTTRRN
jgi:uncharacterized membrane protein YqhA